MPRKRNPQDASRQTLSVTADTSALSGLKRGATFSMAGHYDVPFEAGVYVVTKTANATKRGVRLEIERVRP